MFLLFLGVMALFCGGVPKTAGAQDNVEEIRKKVEELEKVIEQQDEQQQTHERELQELRKKIAAQQEKSDEAQKEATRATAKKILSELLMDYREPTPEEERLETIYDDGFYMRGKDDVLKIGGWYQFDGRFYADDDHPRADTFTNRRARLDVRGTLEDYFAYRIYGTFIGSPVLQEGWLEYHYFPSARLKIGQVKEPFSLESQYSARWIDFVERSMVVTALQPAEDVGVMVFGNLLADRVTYGIGAFNGQGRGENAVVDDKDVTGRITVQPFGEQEDSFLRQLYIGGSLSTGDNEIDLEDRDIRTAGQTPFYDFAVETQADGRITRYSAELEWLKGPFDLTTEFVGANFDEVEAADEQDELTVNGWYATLSWVLTGEAAQRNKPIKPSRNFDIEEGGWGAFQVLGRYERFEVTDRDLIEKGIAIGSDGADGYTLGITWWPNVHIKFMLNYVYTDFDQTITVSGKEMDDENVVLMRGQFNF